MSVELTQTTKDLISNIAIEPNVILKIDGLDSLYGTRPVLTQWKLDDGYYFDDGLFFDTPAKDKNSRDYISLGGSSKNISQQILIDKGATSSISSVTLELIDKDGYVSNEISYSGALEDILSTKASVFLGFQGGSHPQDSVQIFRGLITDLRIDVGSVRLTIASGDELRRQNIFTQAITETQEDIDDNPVGAITIDMESTEGFIPSGDSITAYAKIEDEILEVTSMTSSTLTMTRAALGSVPAAHDSGAEVTSFYKLDGYPIDLALKLMLSNEGNEFVADINAKVYEFNGTNIYFESDDIERDLGLIPGDSIRIDGSVNNDGDYIVSSFGKTELGNSYVVTLSSLTFEEDVDCDVYVFSQYNVLPDGLGLNPDEVDVAGHMDVIDFFGTGFSEYSFYLKDTINGRDFIDNQLFFPSGLYSIPRKSRVSVKMTTPPLTVENTPRLDATNITNINKLTQRRSTFKNLYNTVVYKYNQGALEDKYYSGYVRANQSSKSRIRSGNKQFLIESDGLRKGAETNALLLRQSQRFIDRYKFAAREISGVEVLYRDGFAIEIGDTVEFGGANTQLINMDTGQRDLPVGLYEVTNRDLNFTNGKIRLTLLETDFDNTVTYGVISPGSNVISGSTTTSVFIENSFGTIGLTKEKEKWTDSIGETIRLKTDDYSYDQECVISGFSLTNDSEVYVTGLSVAPPAGALMSLADYNESSDDTHTKFVFVSPVVEITGVTNSYTYTCDTTNLFVGAHVVIRSLDFTRDSFGTDLEIVSIIGSTVVLNASAGFTVQVGDVIDGIGFNFDNGNYYASY